MAASPQVLVLDPPTDLRFRGPSTGAGAATALLALHNPSPRPVCFKVKSTAPGRYCVRPRCGVLPPGAGVTVAAALLQPGARPRPGPAERRRHKFLVQTMFAPPDADASDLQAVWRRAKPGELMDSKLTCVFETASGDGSPQRDGKLQKDLADRDDDDDGDAQKKPPGIPAASLRARDARPLLPVLLLVAMAAVCIGVYLGKFIL
uniref:vesicle-associated membrane protein-associated protein A-like n=1 Tax=Jaculus jaculus TaxID=51337 RepID=UPI001E1B30B2|nr:vesicle-associated membrane protein-associated protein A-like [Jaculus jaculus]